MNSNKLKVLVVDDDKKFLTIMKQSLESKNCDVTCVSDGFKAISLLVNQPYQLVFIDCVLYSHKGTEIVQEIREVLGNSVQIILMSGVIPEKSLSSYIDVGICDFLSKPISDKELEQNLRKVKEKHVYGSKNNILVKLFSHNIPFIQKLKLLVSLQKIKDYELFFYLSTALASKDSIYLKFTFNNKNHEIFIKDGNIIDYKCNDANMFIQRLVSKKIVDDNDIVQLVGLNEDKIVKSLINNCILSAGQLFDLKYELLIETLKEITPGMEISVNFNLQSFSSKDHFILLEQGEYSDIVFLFLKQRFNNQLFSIFSEDIMDKHIIFNETKGLDYFPEMSDFVEDLKRGMKLKGIYDQYINDKNLFCFYIIYVLLKGNAYLSGDNINFRHNYLKERYEKLYKFITKTKTAREVFVKLSESPMMQSTNQTYFKNLFNSFIKYNHPDKIDNLPESILDLVNKTIIALQNKYEREFDPKLMMEIEKKSKEKQIKQEILLTEKKKIIERDLETKSYQKAYSLLKDIPVRVLDKETDWQLIYLWVHFKDKNLFEKNKTEVHRYMKVIQAQKRDLQSNRLFYFVLGLYCLNKGSHIRANKHFKRAKELDPSFQPVYSEIKDVSIELLKQ